MQANPRRVGARKAYCGREWCTQVKAHATTAQPRVKQAKILMEETPPGGRVPAKSRGRGFVEFAEHDHAMAALRHLNNSPTPFGE